MKNIILYAAIFMMAESLLEARGGGGFHGGGGGHMGGSRGGSGSRGRSSSRASSSSRSHSSSRSSSSSRNRSGSRNGNTYNHTNNFYGGHGYGGWGAWGAFGFTALATTGIVLAASSAGNGNSAQLQKTLTETQIEMEQLQKRLDALENQNDQNNQIPDVPANEQSPFNDPKAIKAYIEQLKKAQTDLKAAQIQQKNSSENNSSNDYVVDTTSTEQSAKTEDTEKKIETLQDRLNSLKAQLYDYWYGTNNSAA